jgi:hypothetical protein
VEFTANLEVGWAPIGDPVEATATVTTATYSSDRPARGFYRVTELQ